MKLAPITWLRLILLSLLLNVRLVHAQTTAFTYQGKLNDGTNATNGHYDLAFTLFSVSSGEGQVGLTVTKAATSVSNGLFNIALDFGAEVFTGAPRWLEIAVRTNVADLFTTLSPRQLLTPVPYAIVANAASNLLGTLPASQINGTISDATFPASPNFSGTVAAANFSGNGVNVTNVNASTLDGFNSSYFWKTTGNSGTSAGTHFLGTTDDQPLELRVNGQRGLRLESGGSNSVNVIGGWSGNGVASGVVGGTVAGGGAANWVFSVYRNRVEADFGTVSGGGDNNIAGTSLFATIAGGANNHIGTNSQSTTISGGYNNNTAANSPWATISGGVLNDIGTNSHISSIGGGFDNDIAPWSPESTIAGGRLNKIGAGSYDGAIGGGQENSIADNSGFGTIAGGTLNRLGANSAASAIGGGINNKIADFSSEATIAGGVNNDIGTNSNVATIGGGYDNTVGDNSAYATIPGGRENSATNYAFAAGRQAKANHEGAFVWGDSYESDVSSANNNSVTMRASGGYRLFSNSDLSAGVFLAAGGGSWTSISDRNAKENFKPVNARAVLDKVSALPLSQWNYKSQPAEVLHMGPMAQDFKAAFGVGESDTGITTIDADGVALAAIQGLNQKLEEQRSENTELKQRLTRLEQLVSKITDNRD